MTTKPEAAAAPAPQTVTVDRPELEFDRLLKMGSSLVKTGFLPPSIKTADQTAMIVLTGRELGIPAMQALRTIHVIQGKPALSAELMAALVIRAGHKIQWLASGDEGAICKITRTNGVAFEGKFDAVDAKRAGLIKQGSGWEKFPAALYRARALSLTARAICPDAIMGFHLAEEMGAEVDETGVPVATVTPIRSVPEPAGAADQPAAEETQKPPDASGDGETGTYIGPVVSTENIKGPNRTFYVIHGRDGFRCRTFDRKEADIATEASVAKGEVKIDWVQTRYGPKLIQIAATGEGIAPERGSEEDVPF